MSVTRLHFSALEVLRKIGAGNQTLARFGQEYRVLYGTARNQGTYAGYRLGDQVNECLGLGWLETDLSCRLDGVDDAWKLTPAGIKALEESK